MKRYSQAKPDFLFTPNPERLARKAFSLLLAASICVEAIGMGFICPQAAAQLLDTSAAKPVRGQVSIARDVNIAPGSDKVSLNMRDASLRDVLNMLAEQGKFNLILDESVDGTLTVDIKNISINKALEYVFTVADLSYTKDGNTVIVAAKDAADKKNLTAKTFKAIPVQYKDASIIANRLNSTLFKVARPGGSTTAIAASDPDSNSLLIIGTDSDLKLVADALRELDVPRNRKVYQVRHNTPTYVAQVLAANFFTPSVGSGTTGGNNGGANGNNNNNGANGNNNGGGANGNTGNTGGTTGNTGTTGGTTGTTGNTNGGASTGGAGGSTGTTGAGLSTFTTGGVTFISEPIASTLTVLATDEQLSLIDSLIDQVDVRKPQVVIEVSLVELQNTDTKSFKPLVGPLNLAKEAQLTLNKNGISTFVFSHANNDYSSDTTNNPGGLKQNNILTSLSMTATNNNTRNKVLANPTIVAMDNTTSTITITDQIPTITQTVTTTATGPVTATNITTQDAGVTLSITPQVNLDGYITLKVAPEVSQPAGTVSTDTASTVLISKRTLNISGVRVKDGETLVIGGLVREGDRIDMTKVPGLEKLPIVSAMFRSINNHSKDKTELVLMVTPHILKDEAATYFQNTETGKFTNPNQGQGGFQPVSLPKFIGPMAPDNAAPVPLTGNASNASPSRDTEGDAPEKGLLPPQSMQVSPASTVRADAFRLPPKQADASNLKRLPELLDEIVKD